MFKFADKPSSVFQIFMQGFDLYKNTFFKVWYIILFNFAIISAIQFFTPQLNVSQAVSSGDGAAVALTKADVGNLWLSLLVGLTFSLYFTSVVMHRIYHLASSPNASIVSSYFIALRKLIFILITFVIILIVVVFGLMMGVVPGVFLMFLFCYFLAAILFEDKKVFSAIKASCQLVWGNWWHTFNVLLLFPVIGILFMLGLVWIFQITNSVWLVNVIFLVFFLLASPLFLSVYLVQYNDLKMRKLQP